MGKARDLSLLFVLILSMAGCATPLLIRAAEDGDLKTATSLLDEKDGVDINENYFGHTPLMDAIINRHTEMVKLLIERGADVDYPGNFVYHPADGSTVDRTPLLQAVITDQPEIVKLLIDNDADVNKPGISILLLEAKKNRNKHIEQILKAAHSNKSNNLFSGTPIIKGGSPVLIAVIDFEAKGVSRQDASRLSEWLRTELINTNQFKVIERSAMNTILKEQAFTMTGCTDTSCAVQVGKLLSARKMLVGSVEVWNNKVFINGRIIDVEKGVAEFAHRETVSSLKELDTGATSFAKNLARRINGLPVE